MWQYGGQIVRWFLELWSRRLSVLVCCRRYRKEERYGRERWRIKKLVDASIGPNVALRRDIDVAHSFFSGRVMASDCQRPVAVAYYVVAKSEGCG